jgi:tRNA A-37 threonylcarbamoyl transferase component Bud32
MQNNSSSLPTNPVSTTPENSFSESNNFDNPFNNPQQNNQMQHQVEQNNTNDNLHKDITKAKIETIESRITLIDAKLASIDQKLEIITKLIQEEVSEETKRKLNVQSMMGNIKDK